MSTEIVKADALPVKSMQELTELGDLLAQSGMFGVKSKGGGVVVAATCIQQGITLMDYARTYHTIDNKPSMKADAMAAEFRKRGGRYKIINRDNEAAKAEFSFENQKVPFSFTIEDAKEKGYCFKADGKTLKDNWRKTPDSMLWARMMSTAVRVLCPEIVAGLYTPEELQDIDDLKPADPAVQPKPIQTSPAETKPAVENVVEDAEIIPTPDFDKSVRVNFNVCPVKGALFGVAWADMDKPILEQALQLTNAEMTDEHRNAVTAAIKQKEG